MISMKFPPNKPSEETAMALSSGISIPSLMETANSARNVVGFKSSAVTVPIFTPAMRTSVPSDTPSALRKLALI